MNGRGRLDVFSMAAWDLYRNFNIPAVPPSEDKVHRTLDLSGRLPARPELVVYGPELLQHGAEAFVDGAFAAKILMHFGANGISAIHLVPGLRGHYLDLSQGV